MGSGKKIKVFMTGATGVMGTAGLRELLTYPDDYDITVLARPSKRNKKKLKDYEAKGVKVVWGDLLEKESLRKGIEKADIVLHVGGMVSPAAEHFPEKTLKVNLESSRLIASIIKEIETAQPERTIKMVYIGSVSQYGSKMPPNHWGKAGDKLVCAKFDAYALSKILAERAMVEMGLKKWVSLRQTAILHAGLLMKANDPVTFHVPLNGAIEWISVEDSGRLLERVCRENIPEDFWNKFYNVGGGETFRKTNLEFEREILKAMGCPAPEKVFEPNWFATDNFHGIWFADSDLLDNILHYREKDTFEDALKRLKKEIPFYFKLVPIVPAFLIKLFMKKVAQTQGLGTLSWIKNGEEGRIKAAWGSIDNYRQISGWKNFEELHPVKKCPLSFSNSKFIQETTSCQQIPFETIETTCERGHHYLTSRYLEKGGHSCPICLKNRG